jgi:hypothetical protein
MLSNLGPLFRTTFRQAESADARMEIHREEKDSGKRKHSDDDPANADNSLWEDSMAVSIPALLTFLNDFLKNHGAPASSDALLGDPLALADDATDVHTLMTSVSPVAAKAVKAYTSLSAPPAAPPPPSTSAPDHSLSPLKPEEIQAIFRLMRDLNALHRAGQETLTFRMTGTFVDSLQEAVDTLKVQPSSAS